MLLSALSLALLSATASVSATGPISNTKRHEAIKAHAEKRGVGFVPEFGAAHWEGGTGFRTFPAKAVSRKRSKPFGKRQGKGAFSLVGKWEGS